MSVKVALMEEGSPHRASADLNEYQVGASSSQRRHDSGTSSDGETIDKAPRKGRLRHLTSKTKAKTKKLLNFESGGSLPAQANCEHNEALRYIQEDLAFNPSKLAKSQSVKIERTTDKTIGVLQTITTTVLHPKRTIISKVKRTTAGNLSSNQRPHLSRQVDHEFLEAHDNLSRAQSTISSRHGTSDDNEVEDEETSDCRDKVAVLEAHRESLAVAWTTSHIDRVRVVPKEHLKFPDPEAFIERDDTGSHVRYRWEKWLGNILVFYTQDFSAQYIDDFDELPFSLESLRKHVERAVVASAPWQTWILNVRAIYRWEEPRETGMWLALYVTLWYTEHIMGFLWLYIIYFVVKYRFYPTSVQSLRESVRRSVDREGVASRLGELIDKHGRENWIEPLVEELGPYIQLQIGDIANMLEVFANFYYWRSPAKTASSIVFFASLFLISIFTDMRFCMKIAWFIVGGSFFLCWPIASIYPKYRYLVSPLKWIFWDIPTHDEWSFQYLRRQAQLSREEMINQKVTDKFNEEITSTSRPGYTGRIDLPRIVLEADGRNDTDSDSDWHSTCSTTSVLDSTSILSFRARWHGVNGRLVIYSSGVRFVRNLTAKEMWKITFLEMAEMRKLQGSKLTKIAFASPEQLEFELIDGSAILVESIKGRDEAFNSIIGFSNLQWQSLQTGPGKGGNKARSVT